MSYNITDEFFTKISNQEIKVLNQYAEKTIDKGSLYYVDSLNKQNNEYKVYVCDGENFEIKYFSIDELPKDVEVGSTLRKENEEYVMDTSGTNAISKKLNAMLEKQLETQEEELNEKRIEGHLYKLTKVEEENFGKSTYWLTDITVKNEPSFEETMYRGKVILKYVDDGYEFERVEEI